MKYTVVCVGKLKERFWKDACTEYTKRLGAYAKVDIREVADIDPAKAGGVDAARDKEGASEELSARLDDLMLRGSSDIAFVIGGSDGVSDEVRARADEMLSFGRITLPHNLARVVLLEQVYRACKISRGEPYHK